MRYIYIYIYLYICQGPCIWIGTSLYTKCLGFKGENIQIVGVDGLYIYIYI